jgi:hypothetical protein
LLLAFSDSEKLRLDSGNQGEVREILRRAKRAGKLGFGFPKDAFPMEPEMNLIGEKHSENLNLYD